MGPAYSQPTSLNLNDEHIVALGVYPRRPETPPDKAEMLGNSKRAFPSVDNQVQRFKS